MDSAYISFALLSSFYFLSRYRISEGVNLPFRVLPTIKEVGRTRLEVNVKVCVDILKDVSFNLHISLFIFLVSVGKECIWCKNVCTWRYCQGPSSETHSQGKLSSDIWSSKVQCHY